MSIEKKDNEEYNKTTYDIPFHEEKYEQIERDEKIEYSEFLYNPPVCLLSFNDGYYCAGRIDKSRPFKIGDGTIHDAYELCVKCETIKYIKNKIKELEDIKVNEIKIPIHVCKHRGRFNIIDKTHYCNIYGEYKDVQFCKNIKCIWLLEVFISRKLDDLFNQIKI